MISQLKIGRREFLQRSGQFTGGLILASALSALAAGGKRLKVAAIITAFTYRSHAHVILENFVSPYLFNGKWISPGLDVVSMYADQFPDGELGRAFAARYEIPMSWTWPPADGFYSVRVFLMIMDAAHTPSQQP